MEDFGILILLVTAFLFLFDDDTKFFFKNDRTRESEVHQAEPDENKSTNPQKNG